MQNKIFFIVQERIFRHAETIFFRKKNGCHCVKNIFYRTQKNIFHHVGLDKKIIMQINIVHRVEKYFQYVGSYFYRVKKFFSCFKKSFFILQKKFSSCRQNFFVMQKKFSPCGKIFFIVQKEMFSIVEKHIFHRVEETLSSFRKHIFIVYKKRFHRVKTIILWFRKIFLILYKKSSCRKTFSSCRIF